MRTVRSLDPNISDVRWTGALLTGEKVAEKIYDTIILETLELRGNTLGVDATLPIAEALECRPEMKVIQAWAAFCSTGTRSRELRLGRPLE